MTSLRQIEANRRNARLSNGPITDEGKRRSRQNAVRHGLTAETVIDAMEDTEDYAGFEMAVTADYDAALAVKRELVLRLASVLWRLRRATAIESGLFKMEARRLLKFRPRRTREVRQRTMEPPFHEEMITDESDDSATRFNCSPSVPDADGLTSSYMRLADLPTYPLDRLSRYEGTLWRQARQILNSLRALDRRNPLGIRRL